MPKDIDTPHNSLTQPSSDLDWDSIPAALDRIDAMIAEIKRQQELDNRRHYKTLLQLVAEDDEPDIREVAPDGTVWTWTLEEGWRKGEVG